MAIHIPLTSPWLITIAGDTNEHTLDMSKIANGKIHPQLGMAVRIDKISAPVQFRVVQVGAPVDQIDADNPALTTTDSVAFTIHANQEIRIKGAAGGETFHLYV